MSEIDDGTDESAFVEAMARYCDCCRDCAMTPCEGVLAGGMCDGICRCDTEDDNSDDETP